MNARTPINCITRQVNLPLCALVLFIYERAGMMNKQIYHVLRPVSGTHKGILHNPI